jgi:hypothetical protein
LLADGTEGANWIERMEDMVKESNPGKQSIIKSMRYLRHVWIEKGDADELRSDAIELYRSGPTEKSSIILSWGMVVATYPFLNDVASNIGRMLRVQPEVKLEQLLRKLSETYGERETVRRSGRYALGLITDFGFVERTESAGCYHLGKPLKPDTANLSAWMVRAWFASTGGSAVIDRVVMTGSPGLAFFDSAALISDAIKMGILVPERLSFSQDVLRLDSPKQSRQS